MDILPVNIELVDESNLDADELSQFVDVEPLQLGQQQKVVGRKIINLRDEEDMIKKLVDGKLSFSDYKDQVLDHDAASSDDDSDDNDEFVLEEEDYEDDDEEEEEEEPSNWKKAKSSTHKSSSSHFETELDSQRKNQLRGQFSSLATGRGRRKKSVLPPALQGLMGEANLRYARGDTETAETVCMEIIRQVPLAVEPFHTLAQIYEGKDNEKYMQYMFIAAHLNPSDTDHWLQLAEMSEDAGNTKQAYMCLTRASRSQPANLEIRNRRIEMMREMGDEKAVLKAQLHMIGFIKDPEYQMELTKEVSRKYHDMGHRDYALTAYRYAHKTNGDHFPVVEVNKYLDLLMDANLYEDALNVLCQHTKIELGITPRTKSTRHSIFSANLPKDLIPDFRTKASVCLVHLKCPTLHQYIVDEALAAFNPEEDGDCLLDIAEALMAVDAHSDAIKLLHPLVQSEKFGLAAVYLRYADCLRLLDRTEEAIESYKTVIQMAPQHLDARLTLSALLKQKNRQVEALQALEQDLESDVLEPTLLYEHCFMLKETGNIDQYIDLCGVLFSRHWIKLRNREELEFVIANIRVPISRNSIMGYREFRLEDCDDPEAPEFVVEADELDREKEYEMFCDVLKQCYYTKRFLTMETYAHQGLTSKRFTKHRLDIRFMALTACLSNKDYTTAFVHAKEILLRNPKSRRAWNLVNACFYSPANLIRHHRFVRRFITRSDGVVEPEVRIWLPTYSLAAGTYNTAAREFSEAFKRTKDPFAALLTAIALSHLAIQKFTHHKADHINQAIVLLEEYAKIRLTESEQEVHYNTGRMYHQLGLIANAAGCYKKVLECKSYDEERLDEILDLKMEAAYNLHLIYKESGNAALAKKYLYDYVVV